MNNVIATEPQPGDVNETIFKIGDKVRVNNIPVLATVTRINWFTIWLRYEDGEVGVIALNDCTPVETNAAGREIKSQQEVYGDMTPAEIAEYNAEQDSLYEAYEAALGRATVARARRLHRENEELQTNVERLHSELDKALEDKRALMAATPDTRDFTEAEYIYRDAVMTREVNLAHEETAKLQAELDKERAANVALTARNRRLVEASAKLLHNHAALVNHVFPGGLPPLPAPDEELTLNLRLEMIDALNASE